MLAWSVLTGAGLLVASLVRARANSLFAPCSVLNSERYRGWNGASVGDLARHDLDGRARNGLGTYENFAFGGGAFVGCRNLDERSGCGRRDVHLRGFRHWWRLVETLRGDLATRLNHARCGGGL